MNLLQNYHLAVIEYLSRGRRAVPLQTFTTRHSNRKLFIVIYTFIRHEDRIGLQQGLKTNRQTDKQTNTTTNTSTTQ